MKKIFLIAGLACTLGACNNSEKAAAEAQQRAIDSMKLELVRQKAIDSMNAVAAETAAIQEAEMEQQKAAAATSTRRSGSGSARSTERVSYNTTNNYAGAAPAAGSSAPAQPAQKKRWSSKATGTLIGAGAGALGGALISDKKGKGAIIGGVSGAAVGLGTGAIIDAERKRKERERLEQQQQDNR